MAAMPGTDASWQIQLLRGDDLHALTAHLVRLDRADRRNRFGGVMSDRWLADFAHGCDRDRDIIVVLKRGTQIGGVCHLAIYRDAEGLPAAELGISVDAPMRRAGWATRMLREALRIAHGRGVARLVVHYLRSNLPMAAFANSVGAIDEEQDAGEVTASLPLLAVEHQCPRRTCPFWVLCSEAQGGPKP